LRVAKVQFACAIVLLGAAISLASPARADDLKPDASIKTKAIEASVSLDSKIKADTALAANCLAEGKKWMEKSAADAASELKQDPQFFKDGGWEFGRNYSVRSAAIVLCVMSVTFDTSYLSIMLAPA
jgi:hypothetical protein